MTAPTNWHDVMIDSQTPGAFLAQAPPVAGDPQSGAQPGQQADGSQPIGGQGAQQGQAPQGLFGGGFIFVLLGMFVFMLVLSSMGQRKEKKKRAAMLGALGKHDRVQTSGGVIGTVVEVRGDEITLKVDESTNTKIRFAKSAVQQVLRQAGGPGDQDAEPDAEEPAEERELAQQA